MVTASQDLNFKMNMTAGAQVVRILVDCLDTDSKLVVMPSKAATKKAKRSRR